MTDRADLPRDAWLSEALRHAPDRIDAPPAALTEAILREAATQAATPRGLAGPGGMERLWQWIARPRVAAGFATLTVVTLVGLMWRERPMDDVMPQAPSREAPAMGPRPTFAAPPASSPAEASTGAPPRAAVPAAPAKLQAPAAKTEPTPTPTPTPAPPPAAAAPPPATAAAPVEQKLEQRAAPSAARAPSPAPATEPPVPPGPMASRGPPAVADGVAGASEATADRARRAVGRVDEDAPSTLAGLRTAIAAQPARWTWQTGSAPPQPFTPAVSAWLQQVEAAVGGRRMTIDGNSLSTRELRLWRDGRPLQAIRLSGGTLHWQRADEAAGGVAVELGEPSVRRLIESLDTATR